jgi:hypothetical protein
MSISSTFRSRVAAAGIGAFLIVKADAAPNSCVKAAAATDKILGTSDELDHVAGEMVDIAVGPIGKVRLGAVVAAGDALTSNVDGKAIATTTTGNRIIGFAEQAGVLNDVITYLRAPGVV